MPKQIVFDPKWVPFDKFPEDVPDGWYWTISPPRGYGDTLIREPRYHRQAKSGFDDKMIEPAWVYPEMIAFPAYPECREVLEMFDPQPNLRVTSTGPIYTDEYLREMKEWCDRQIARNEAKKHE
jgi:hypothetical protein